MSLQKINLRNSLLVLCIFLVGMLRIFNETHLLTPLANFTPIGAMALFGGTYFTGRTKSFLFPLLALLISDILVMRLFYPDQRSGLLYPGWIWTYAAFALMVFIGRKVKKVTAKNVLIAAVSAAMAHWIITDYGVWLAGGIDITTRKPLARDLHGFVQCYLQALPYLKNMLLGNIVYCIILFGGFEWLQNRYTVLKPQTN